MKYSVEVDREKCVACANCYSTDPHHFDHTDNGKSKVVGGTVNGKSAGHFDNDRIEDANTAADACPAQAITVTEI